MRLVIIGMALSLAACAETPKQTAARLADADETRAALDRELAGLVPGTPQNCLQTFDRREAKSFGDTLVYRGADGVRYVTQTTGCRRIGEDNILVTVTPTPNLCRGDIATTIDRTARFQSGSCSFGEFTPYRRPSS